MQPADSALLVIPCYHESGRIRPFLRSLREVFAADERLTVQLVEDGSEAEEQARMRDIVETERAGWPRLKPLLAMPKNQGKGGAIYSGWAAHEGQAWLAFADADGSCTARETARLLELARQSGAGHAKFASRLKILGHRVERDLKRHLMGRVFATMVSELLSIPVYDSQCGLKVVDRAAYERIAPLLTIKRFAFDVELLAALLDSGCAVQEVPIDWTEIPGGTVRLFRDSWLMFNDVLKVRAARQSEPWRKLCSSESPG